MEDEKLVLNYFFTNDDRPIFALKNMPPMVQQYIYMGISRFPNVRERFLKFLKKTCDFDKVVEFIKKGKDVNLLLKNFSEFAGKKNKKIYFDFKHRSTGEGSNIFVVSENNPIYATGIQQDFFFPMTTMELSTRYSKAFNKDRVYYDPKLMNSEFKQEAKDIIERNFELYNSGFEILKNEFKEKREKGDLPEKVSILDSLRSLIPIAAYTTVVLGCNTRAMLNHFKKMLSYNDSFIQEYAKKSLKEMSKIIPDFFSDVKRNGNVVKREQKLKQKANDLFENEFIESKDTVRLYTGTKTNNLVLAQLLYPYCHLTFEKLLEHVRNMSEKEKKSVFNAATEDRINRKRPTRGFSTRPLVFEIEAPWRLWKDFKRNRMNLRFQQEMRGKSGYEIPELIENSKLRNDYEEAMKNTSDLIEKIYQKYGGSLSKTVAAQGNKKRFLLCMDPRQLTVLGELRTCGEGDKGYRKIASTMIQMTKENDPNLFEHVNDNYKN